MAASLEDAIAETKALVGGLIRKPKMTDKLLARPPFRFLHDTIMAINANNQFIDALLSEEERDSTNIKDSKSAKLEFLRKVIAFASICSGDPIDVREAKIVAGAEPINTNALLQALARAASDDSIDYATAARLALDGVPPGRVPRRGAGASTSGAREAKVEEADEPAAVASTPNEAAAAETKQQDSGATRAAEAAASESKAPEPEAGAGEAKAGDDDGGAGALAGADGSVETTMQLFEGLVRKPKLTPKLLGRPPFRFLHDVMTGLRGATGLLEGLFQGEEELDAKQCTSKEAKLAYLEKLIRFTEICSGAPVEARASRIVAGQETENTNMLLQTLAILARNPAACAVSPAEAVEIALGGGPAPAAASGSKRSHFDAAAAAAITEQVQLKGGDDDDDDDDNASAEKRRGSRRSDASSSSRRNSRPAADVDAAEPEAKATDETEAADEAEAKDDGDGAARKKVARPQTARKRPPKIRERTAGAVEKPPSRGQAAPVGVMREGDDDSDESDGEMEKGGAEGAAVNRQRNNENADPDQTQRLKSRLVRDILDDEQKQDAAAAAEAAAQPENNDESKADERPASRGITMGKIGRGLRKSGKGNPAGVVDVDKIRDAIQLVCQSTNPLGKCMDFVHEDLGTMSKELEKWKSEFRKCCDAMEDEERITSETLLPLRGKLTEIDENIRDKNARIATLKASIAKNDQRIAELLRDMVLN